MRQALSYVALGLTMLSIVGCSDRPYGRQIDDQTLFQQTLDPTPPTASELTKTPLPKQNLVVQLTNEQSSQNSGALPRPEPSLASNFMTIMGQNGAVITVWALAQRNWLWAYAPIDSQDFGNIRNWRIERSFRREHFRFLNQALGSCMQAYGNGVIHDGCDPNNLDQDFELMPTDRGAVFIKSVSQQRCITYNPVSSTVYTTLWLSQCDDTNITPLNDQTFYLTPPLLSAQPITQ
ncbi:toxin [Pasteurellaceae bacterium Orientalotternb1]|nr:toxin [Pasteurellaceae bacterium Orientalotternb1]